MTTSMRARRVVVVGNTHGNEKSGYWVVRAMRECPERFQRPGLEVSSLVANPEAEARNLRYVDVDLNRCFGPRLDSDPPDCRERRRALEIREEIGRPDLLIDVHNTTSAMGVTWMLTSADAWMWWLASEALKFDAEARLLFTPETRESNIFLPSLGRSEITLEIGAVPHGTHDHWAASAAIAHVERILDLLSKAPEDFDPLAALRREQFEYFLGQQPCDYPRDEKGAIRAAIHREFIGTDYRELRKGSPVFHDPVRGETIVHHGPAINPVFVGEAAYVEKGIAYIPTVRRSWDGGREVFA